MAYVALSRVKTLAGLYLVAFNPKCIMVSESSLNELNRLRQAYRSDLPLYSIPVKPKMKIKRKFTGTTHTNHPAAKKPHVLKAFTKKRTQPHEATNAPPSKKLKQDAKAPCKELTKNSTVLQPSPAAKQSSHLVDNDHATHQHQSPFKFHTVDEQWQINACSTLQIRFVRCNRLRPGGPNVSLKSPDNHTIRRITGDGNCLFRSFSYIITGSEEQHMQIRMAICSHMVQIAHLLFASGICSEHPSIQEYIESTQMHQNMTWGTEVEMFTLAHLLQTSVFSYNTVDSTWWRYSPHFVDRSVPEDITAMAMYIRHQPGHFDVVRSVLKSTQ